jgi:hypothetical protein
MPLTCDVRELPECHCEGLRGTPLLDFATIRSNARAVSELTPLGEYLEAARGGLSKREAARRAGVSEGRWRQVVTGRHTSGGVQIPVNPKPETVIKMAQGVGADPRRALDLAGLDSTLLSEDQEPGAPVGEGIDPAAMADLQRLSPDEVEKVRAYARGLLDARRET